MPELLFATFQLSFAIITAALVMARLPTVPGSPRGWCSSRSGRSRCIPLWPTGYGPWWLAVQAGALDYAGGLVVEIVSGASALALALVLGPRIGFKVEPMRPHNLPFVLLGVGPCGSAGSGSTPGRRWPPTGWRQRSSSTPWWPGVWACWAGSRSSRSATASPPLGAASGVVAGLVAITPSCGTVNTLGAAVVGLAAGVVCSFAIGLKFKLNYDDSLDVVGVHFVGGVIGVVLIGLLATSVMTGGAQGTFFGGGLGQLGKQLLAVGVVGGYAFAVTYRLARLIDKIMGFRVSPEDEAGGVDFAQHAETAYAEGVHGHQQVRRPLI